LEVQEECIVLDHWTVEGNGTMFLENVRTDYPFTHCYIPEEQNVLSSCFVYPIASESTLFMKTGSL
jgi:hypothetical protein